MELIVGVFLELVVAVVAQVLFEVAFALGWVTVSSPFRRERDIPVAWAVVGIAILAAVCAWLFDLLFPTQLFKAAPIPGVSLIVSPFAVGALTHIGGRWLEKKNRRSAHLMTFWGGALLAFVFSATRFLLLR